MHPSRSDLTSLDIHPLSAAVWEHCPLDEKGAKTAIEVAMIKLGHPADSMPDTREGWEEWLKIAFELKLAARQIVRPKPAPLLTRIANRKSRRPYKRIRLTPEGEAIWRGFFTDQVTRSAVAIGLPPI